MRVHGPQPKLLGQCKFGELTGIGNMLSFAAIGDGSISDGWSSTGNQQNGSLPQVVEVRLDHLPKGGNAAGK